MGFEHDLMPLGTRKVCGTRPVNGISCDSFLGIRVPQRIHTLWGQVQRSAERLSLVKRDRITNDLLGRHYNCKVAYPFLKNIAPGRFIQPLSAHVHGGVGTVAIGQLGHTVSQMSTSFRVRQATRAGRVALGDKPSKQSDKVTLTPLPAQNLLVVAATYGHGRCGPNL